MRKGEQPASQIKPATVKVDNRGQRYLVHPDGQLKRITPDGTPLPRIRLTKKERLKLRREYREIEELNQKDLADKIIEAPVVNPVPNNVNATGD